MKNIRGLKNVNKIRTVFDLSFCVYKTDRTLPKCKTNSDVERTFIFLITLI